MNEEFQNMKGGITKNYRLYAWLAIACPIITLVASYLERIITYAKLAQSNVPALSLPDALMFGHQLTMSDLGEWVPWVGIASIAGFVLAVRGGKLKKGFSFSVWLAFVVNVPLFLFFVPLLVIAIAIEFAF